MVQTLYVAGRLSAELPGERTDAALVAEGVACAFGTPLRALAASTDAATLREAGLTRDIAYCALESELDVVPGVVAFGTGVALIARLDQLSVAPREIAAVDADDTVSV